MTPVLTLSIAGWMWSISLPATLTMPVVTIAAFFAIRRALLRLNDASTGRRVAVVLLNALVVVALLLLLAPPQWPQRDSAAVVLVTEGAAAVPDGSARYRFGDSTATPDGGTTQLATVGQLLVRHPGLQGLHLLGHGLDDVDWASLPGTLSVDWRPPPLEGLTDLRWPSALDEGAALVVAGRWRDDPDAPLVEVQMLDPARAVVDSATLRGGDNFTLSALPRTRGPLEYQLEVRRGEVLLAQELVAIDVHASSPASLLVLQSAPSFESRQLANWVADRGGELLIETEISAGRQLLQRVNRPADSVAELVPSMLDQIDLALLDGRRWSNLPASKREQLLDAVARGMGLLIQVDADFADWLTAVADDSPFGITLSAAEAVDPRSPMLAADEPASQPLPVAPWRISAADAHMLTRDNEGTVLDTWRAYGRGRLAVSRIRERHRWATAGEQSTFSRYWTKIIEQVGRAPFAPRWRSTNQPTRQRPGERLTLCAQGAMDGPLAFEFVPLGAAESSATAEGKSLPLQAHASGSPEGCGFVWPVASGWHRARLIAAAGTVIDEQFIYIYDNQEWMVDRYARRQAATKNRLQLERRQQLEASQYVPLSAWWGWSLLVVALVSLWWERRQSDLA